MKNLIALIALASVAAAGPAAAQNLVITNARILDGTGKVIERGAVVVRDGKIASVAAGNPTPVPGARVIDARGMTVMPGFIDAHRHPIPAQHRASGWKRMRRRRCAGSSRRASRRWCRRSRRMKDSSSGDGPSPAPSRDRGSSRRRLIPLARPPAGAETPARRRTSRRPGAQDRRHRTQGSRRSGPLRQLATTAASDRAGRRDSRRRHDQSGRRRCEGRLRLHQDRHDRRRRADPKSRRCG